MVKRHHLLIAFITAFAVVALTDFASAQRQYHLDHEWTKIWINQDGSIDLLYDISLTLDSGRDINFVYVGQPQGDFTIGEAMDQQGHVLATRDISQGNNYRVNVTLFTPLRAGQTVRFNLTTNVASMIYEDETNPGNVGMKFIPTLWQEASILDLRVLIVLPSGVTTENLRTYMVDWDNTLTEDGRLAAYWERHDIAPGPDPSEYTFGVSFPKEYIGSYVAAPTFWQRYGSYFLVLGVIAVAVGGIIFVARKRPYLIPKISMETLGVRHGLTAVEASFLLEMAPPKIVTEILYSLLQKRAIWAEPTNPSLKLKIIQPYQDKVGPAETPLRYYEIDFLNAIKEDGALDEEKLAQTVNTLQDTVEEKLRGYCRRDTIDYYRKIAEKAWEQVEQAGTPELASKAYDEQLLWLFLDPDYKTRTQTAFRDRAFEPSPFWLWYWYSYSHYHPHPTYKPNVQTPTQAGKPPTIPGADFANNIATAVEGTSNTIVANLEKFANAIVPAAAASKASHEPARHGASCVCACAACACACACVSCACACAGGGVG